MGISDPVSHERAQCLRKLGITYRSMGRFKESYEHLLKALDIQVSHTRTYA